jgi:hypothetical protein
MRNSASIGPDLVPDDALLGAVGDLRPGRIGLPVALGARSLPGPRGPGPGRSHPGTFGAQG